MDDEKKSKLALLEGREIRKSFHEDEWWFSKFFASGRRGRTALAERDKAVARLYARRRGGIRDTVARARGLLGFEQAP